MIEKDPKVASQYLQQLSDIMRFMLYRTKSEEIELQQELAYIEKYIELQRIRTTNPNYVKYSLHGEANGKKVAPMVFIPFIENAFKHTPNKKIENAVEINVHINNNAIHFACKNQFIPVGLNGQNNGYNGLGNDLIERRLRLIYPNQHTLAVKKEDSQYQVELTILNEKV